MLSAAGGSRELPGSRDYSIATLDGQLYRHGKASRMLSSACPWPLVWPELGEGAEVSGGWRSSLPSHPAEAQFRVLDEETTS